VIAISHPHYYTAMVETAERLDARILLHEADRKWVQRPSERIDFWSGDRLRVSGGLELVHLGGHFAILETLDFDRVYGVWRDTVVADDAKAKVLRSADRYVDAIPNGRR